MSWKLITNDKPHVENDLKREKDRERDREKEQTLRSSKNEQISHNTYPYKFTIEFLKSFRSVLVVSVVAFLV